MPLIQEYCCWLQQLLCFLRSGASFALALPSFVANVWPGAHGMNFLLPTTPRTQACSSKEGSVAGPVPLGDVDDSGLDGIAVAMCDPSADGTADRQVIICRSGYKNQAIHLQVLDLPSPASVAAEEAATNARRMRPPLVQGAVALAADPAVASRPVDPLAPREVANVYTTMPIHHIACFEDLLVVTNGRSVNFYRLVSSDT